MFHCVAFIISDWISKVWEGVCVSPCAFIGEGKAHSLGMNIAYDSSDEAIDAAGK